MVVKYAVRSFHDLNDDLTIKETTGSYHPIMSSSERSLTEGDGSRGLTNIRILMQRSRLIHSREENFFCEQFPLYDMCFFFFSFSFMGLRVLCIIRVKLEFMQRAKRSDHLERSTAGHTSKRGSDYLRQVRVV